MRPQETHAKGSRVRADAQRNLDGLLRAAKELFETTGLDVPIRDIAGRAGVGVGTLYRHFPRRADLVAAVFKQEIDECADVAITLARDNSPFDALQKWTQRFTALAVTKRGLAAALLLDDPAFDDVPARREQRLRPAFRTLFASALAANQIRDDTDPDEFMDAVSSLCMAAYDKRLDYAQRMVALLVDALRVNVTGSGRSGS